MPGSSAGAAAEPASAADSTTRCGAQGTPACTKQRFSSARCWQTATASAGGATGSAAANSRSAPAGTFSNSVVTAAQALLQVRQRGAVGVGRAQMQVGRRAGRAGGVGLEHRDAVAVGLRGVHEHAPELPATEHAEHRAAGQQGHERQRPGRRLRRGRRRRGVHFRSCVMARAASVWRARNSCRRWRSASSWAASMATANKAALAAPAGPMAKVATGMPLGIWTIEYSESTPFRCLLATGTPEHRHHGLGRQHARQVRRTARAGNDRPQPPRRRLVGKGEHVVRHAMRGDHALLVRHLELVQDVRRVTQGLPVAGGAHD